jgi:hypothetical protein
VVGRNVGFHHQPFHDEYGGAIFLNVPHVLWLCR